jgi:hypothetical protein
MNARRRCLHLLRALLPAAVLAVPLLAGGCAVGVEPGYITYGDPYRGVYRHPYWAGAPGPYYRHGYYYHGPRGWDGYTDHVARYSVGYAAHGMAFRGR